MIKKFILLFLIGCSTEDFSFNQINFEENIYLDMDIFYVGSGFPEDYEVIGSFYIGNPRSCSYDAALNSAAKKVKKMGGTAFKIVELKYADASYGCVRIRGLALKKNE